MLGPAVQNPLTQGPLCLLPAGGGGRKSPLGALGWPRQAGGNSQRSVPNSESASRHGWPSWPCEVLCLTLWDPRRDHEGPQANQAAASICGLFSCGPLSPPNTFQPPPQGPGVGQARGACMFGVESALSPQGVAPPPSPSPSNSYLPASQASPLLPRAFSPSCHPLGSGTPVPFQSPPPPPHCTLDPQLWPPFLSQTPTGLQAEPPESPALA